MRDLMNFVDLDARAAGAIAVGMREMAQVDGHQHPREAEMIALLEADLPDSDADSVELDALDGRAVQDAFLKSLALVALVDGALKPTESALIHGYAEKLGRARGEVDAILKDVAQVMLSAFTGVTVFREQAVQIGQSLGLNEDDINEVLDAQSND
ncbi:MAG: hypothetical protein AAFV53_26415 [Myxococcota bacterium]